MLDIQYSSRGTLPSAGPHLCSPSFSKYSGRDVSPAAELENRFLMLRSGVVTLGFKRMPKETALR